jgi:hypothetical protein
LYEQGASAADWFAWLSSDAAPALVSGLMIIACGSALVGYLISSIVWRGWQARKWRRRGVVVSD